MRLPWTRWLNEVEQRNSPSLPTVLAKPGQPVNPPRRKDFESGAGWLEAMRDHVAAVAAFRMKVATDLGLITYRWSDPLNGATCRVAAEHNGQVFRYDCPPECGHPGQGYCDDPKWCRCAAVSIVPGFDD